MRLGILHTGDARSVLHSEHGDYAYMFEQLLSDAGCTFEIVHYRRVMCSVLPASAAECDAWLITGSRHGVYDPLPWISPLCEFIQAAYKKNTPMVGICFGHQIMAQALGGNVVKSEKGWGVGVHKYAIVQPQPGMDCPKDTVSVQVHHQDQVVQLPDDAAVIASSEFCPYAMLGYGTRGISFQGHPEFTTGYAADLIRLRQRLQNGLSNDSAMAGLRTMGAPIDRMTQGKWITNFLNRAV